MPFKYPSIPPIIDKAPQPLIAAKCDIVIALGSGSVIDGAKCIAATAFSDGKSWDYVVLGNRVPRDYTGSFPISSIPTVSVAGSETNAVGVIQNAETNEKSFSCSPSRIPKAEIFANSTWAGRRFVQKSPSEKPSRRARDGLAKCNIRLTLAPVSHAI